MHTEIYIDFNEDCGFHDLIVNLNDVPDNVVEGMTLCLNANLIFNASPACVMAGEDWQDKELRIRFLKFVNESFKDSYIYVHVTDVKYVQLDSGKWIREIFGNESNIGSNFLEELHAVRINNT